MSVQELAAKTAAEIRRRGWHQGSLGSDDYDPQNCRVCILGGIVPGHVVLALRHLAAEDAASSGLDLDVIEARANAATPGPWGALSPRADGASPVTRAGGAWIAPFTAEDDAEFIAHAREDVPALVDEVRRLRGA